MSDLSVPLSTTADPVDVGGPDTATEPRDLVYEDTDESPPTIPSDVYIDHLTPPVGTSFFSKHNITVFSDDLLVWKVAAHVYITGADPRLPDFAGNGGKVYIILVHTGQVRVKKPGKLSVQLDSSLFLELGEMQLPTTYSGEVVENDLTQYTVNFERTMAMFRNDGNEPYTFDAGIQEEFNRLRCKQTGEVVYRYAKLRLNSTEDTNGSPNWPIWGVTTIVSNNITRDRSLHLGRTIKVNDAEISYDWKWFDFKLPVE